MPTLDEINGVSVRTPIRMNLDAYAQALNKIDQRDLQARQITSQINAGLSDLYSKLNVADHPWLQSYIDDINKQIDDAASYGSYANALNTAVDLAGKVASNPELHARMKANQDYETMVKEIQARADAGHISPLTRDRFLSQNPYEFNTETQSLKQYDTPVNNLDMTGLFTKTNAFALSKSLGTDYVKYFDKDGNLTDDFTKDFSGVAYQKYVDRQMRDKESLQEVFDTLLANDNTAYKALYQDYYDTIYELEQYDKKIEETNDPAEKQRLELFKEQAKKKIYYNNQVMTPEQYLFSRSQGVLNNLVVNDSKTQITPGSPYKPIFPTFSETELYDLAQGEGAIDDYWRIGSGSGNSGTANMFKIGPLLGKGYGSRIGGIIKGN